MARSMTGLEQAEHVECRRGNLQHSWHHLHDEVTKTARKSDSRWTVREFVRQLRCSRCKTEAHLTISLPSFAVTKRRYVYPEGYLASGGRVTSADARRELFSRNGIKR